MNQSLAEFINNAQLPAFLALIASVLRVCLSAGALAPHETYAAGVTRKATVVIGSVLTGIVASYLADSHTATKPWAAMLALACGFSAQDICMRLTKRIPGALDSVEDQLERRFPKSPNKKDDHDHN